MGGEVMARIRTLKPEIWSDQRFALLSRDAQLTFIGLITQADDHGRCQADPRLLRSRLWPIDEELKTSKVDSWVKELERSKLIGLYLVDGERFAILAGWDKNQRIDNAGKPRWPDPPPDLFSATCGEFPQVSATRGEIPLDRGSRIEDRGKDQGEDQGVSVPDNPVDPAEEEAVLKVFDHYVMVWKKARYSLTTQRKKKIVTRLKEFTADDLCRAIDAMAADDWVDRPKYCDLADHCLVSQEKVEQWLSRLSAVAPATPEPPPPTPVYYDEFRDPRPTPYWSSGRPLPKGVKFTREPPKTMEEANARGVHWRDENGKTGTGYDSIEMEADYDAHPPVPLDVEKAREEGRLYRERIAAIRCTRPSGSR
jgi:hypothetical protein